MSGRSRSPSPSGSPTQPRNMQSPERSPQRGYQSTPPGSPLGATRLMRQMMADQSPSQGMQSPERSAQQPNQPTTPPGSPATPQRRWDEYSPQQDWGASPASPGNISPSPTQQALRRWDEYSPQGNWAESSGLSLPTTPPSTHTASPQGAASAGFPRVPDSPETPVASPRSAMLKLSQQQPWPEEMQQTPTLGNFNLSPLSLNISPRQRITAPLTIPGTNPKKTIQDISPDEPLNIVAIGKPGWYPPTDGAVGSSRGTAGFSMSPSSNMTSAQIAKQTKCLDWLINFNDLSVRAINVDITPWALRLVVFEHEDRELALHITADETKETVVIHDHNGERIIESKGGLLNLQQKMEVYWTQPNKCLIGEIDATTIKDATDLTELQWSYPAGVPQFNESDTFDIQQSVEYSAIPLHLASITAFRSSLLINYNMPAVKKLSRTTGALMMIGIVKLYFSVYKFHLLPVPLDLLYWMDPPDYHPYPNELLMSEQITSLIMRSCSCYADGGELIEFFDMQTKTVEMIAEITPDSGIFFFDQCGDMLFNSREDDEGEEELIRVFDQDNEMVGQFSRHFPNKDLLYVESQGDPVMIQLAHDSPPALGSNNGSLMGLQQKSTDPPNEWAYKMHSWSTVSALCAELYAERTTVSLHIEKSLPPALKMLVISAATEVSFYDYKITREIVPVTDLYTFRKTYEDENE